MRVDLHGMVLALAGVGFLGLWAAWFWGAVKFLAPRLAPSPFDPPWRRAFAAGVVYLVAIFGYQLALALAFLRWD
jgi:hypothetical protein